MSPRDDGVGADLLQAVPVLCERGVTGLRLVVDQPEVEPLGTLGVIRRRTATAPVREIDHDLSAGVDSLAAHAAQIGQRQGYDICWRAAGRKPVEGAQRAAGSAMPVFDGSPLALTATKARPARTTMQLALVHVARERMTNLLG